MMRNLTSIRTTVVASMSRVLARVAPSLYQLTASESSRLTLKVLSGYARGCVLSSSLELGTTHKPTQTRRQNTNARTNEKTMLLGALMRVPFSITIRMMSAMNRYGKITDAMIKDARTLFGLISWLSRAGSGPRTGS